MASPRCINCPPSVKCRRNTRRKSQVKNFTTVYNMALLFTLGGVVTVLVRHGVGGDRCPAVVCFLGCLGPHLHPWVTHLPTSCSSCSSASGMSLAFSPSLLLSYLSLPLETHCILSATSGSEESKSRCSPKVWVYRARLDREERHPRPTCFQREEKIL